MNKFGSLFGRLRSVLVGMVHLKALPGSPCCHQGINEIIDAACQEADLYVKANYDAIMVENMHDRPWLQPHQMGPETITHMTAICCALRQQYPGTPLGVQVLSSANKEALAIAMAAGLDFVRAEGFVYAHISDRGLVNSCAAELIRYRKRIGAEHVQIFTDVKKKHCSHAVTSDVSIADTSKAAELFLSDGVIVSGTSTGQPTDPKEVADVQAAVDIPVLIGSGVTHDNLSDYMAASGLIVGSSLKVDGHWHKPLDEGRVNRLMEELKRLREIHPL